MAGKQKGPGDQLPPPGEYEEMSERELDEYLDDYIEEDVKLKKKSSGKRFLNFVFLLIALGGFGALAYYAYEFGMIPRDPSKLPVVSATEEPFRVAPENPGGMEIPNQDKTVFDTMDGNKELPTVESILPAPEEPMDVGALEDEKPADSWEDKGTLNEDEMSAEAPAPAPAPEAQKEENALDDVAFGEEPATPAPVVEAPKTPLPTAAEVKAPEAPKKEAAAPAPVTPAKPADNTMDFLREKEKTLEAKTPAVVPPAERPEVIHRPEPSKPVYSKTEGGYSIQLGAFKSESDAKAAWDKIIKRYTEALSGLKVFVERADLGDKGIFYRLKAGTVPNKSKAQELCDMMAKDKQPCFVAK
jgi:cell division septation protein DedD